MQPEQSSSTKAKGSRDKDTRGMGRCTAWVTARWYISLQQGKWTDISARTPLADARCASWFRFGSMGRVGNFMGFHLSYDLGIMSEPMRRPIPRQPAGALDGTPPGLDDDLEQLENRVRLVYPRVGETISFQRVLRTSFIEKV